MEGKHISLAWKLYTSLLFILTWSYGHAELQGELGNVAFGWVTSNYVLC